VRDAMIASIENPIGKLATLYLRLGRTRRQ